MTKFHSFLELSNFHCTHTHSHTHTHTHTPSLSIHPLMGHLGCFCIFALLNNDAMHIEMHVPCCTSVIVSFRCVPRNGIVVSYGNSIFSF